MQMIEVLLLVSNFFSVSLVLGVVTNKDVAAAMENILVLGIQLKGYIVLTFGDTRAWTTRRRGSRAARLRGTGRARGRRGARRRGQPGCAKRAARARTRRRAAAEAGAACAGGLDDEAQGQRNGLLCATAST